MHAKLVAVLLFLVLNAPEGMCRECVKYYFTFGWEAAPGDVVVEWNLNKGCRDYLQGDFNNRAFVIRIATMFDDLILQDTVKGGRYRFNTRMGQDESMIFSIKELDGRERAEAVIRVRKENLVLLPTATKIDSLNAYLLNGCFGNAMAIFEDLKQDNLLAEFRTQLDMMFPKEYPNKHDVKFFNSYVDPSTRRLVQMSYVYETDELVNALNKATKDRAAKPMEIKVLLKVSPESTLQDFAVYPASETETIRALLPLLRLDNPRKELSIALLKISRPYDGKHPNTNYEMVNTRGLIHPDSPGFQKRFFNPLGAVH